jgi:pimeloyl-ACP methyl ester carboxylesterase
MSSTKTTTMSTIGAVPAAAKSTGGSFGIGRLFANQGFHFQTLRALMTTSVGGADVEEVLETIKQIRDNDVQSWFAAWSATGDRMLDMAERVKNPHDKGGALMRAHTYYRTGEFYLPPTDPKRPASWEKNVGCFYKALDTLGVRYERFRAPYEGGTLNAVYYPGPEGADGRPLIMFVGGFDSTLEELHLMLGRSLYERGYSVLTYEGPGQGESLRKHGTRLVPDWERPNSAVLDEFLRSRTKPDKIVLVGMSMGGYFAPRAAAFEGRIDGVVAWDTCYDFADAVARMAAAGASPLAWKNADFVWAIDNACWTLGATDVASVRKASLPFRLATVADRIRQHVLILAGAEDHFIPFHQTADFEAALVNAKSVAIRMYDRISGGAEHCQTGNATLVPAAIVDWITETFG